MSVDVSSNPVAVPDPRTVREVRCAIRAAEEGLGRIAMSPAMALGAHSGWYVRKARLALRQAERWFAKADDPRLEPLAPLRAQIDPRRPALRPPRRKFRCPECFYEALYQRDERPTCRRRGCEGTMERVRALRRVPAEEA